MEELLNKDYNKIIALFARMTLEISVERRSTNY